MRENYKEKLKIARETGKGVVCLFREKANYMLAKNINDCPHCGSKHGHKWESGSIKPIAMKEISKDIYETPSDVKYNCESHDGYSWTEDCKCANCGEMYSQNDGC